MPEGFIHGQPYLLRPIPVISDGRPLTSCLVIHYDLGYLASTVFRRLLEKYSVPDDRLDFQFRLLPNGPLPKPIIFSASQFHYRGDCLLAPRSGAALSMRILGRHESAPVLDATGVASEFVTGEDISPNSLIREAGHCEAPASPSSAGLMQLVVSAPHGALSAIYLGFRHRNEILSGLVLGVLLAALAALVISTERARKLARLEAVIAAGISHELRTPLASLNVAVDHLKKGHVKNAEQARRYGTILEAQSRRLRNVVDQALAVTRLNQPKALPAPRAVCLPQMIQAGLDELAPEIREAGIEVQRSIAADLPMISADPEFVLRSVINLVENAVKYANDGGWIRVSANAAVHAKRRGVEMIVEDHGTGIPQEEFDSIFEPF